MKKTLKKFQMAALITLVLTFLCCSVLLACILLIKDFQYFDIISVAFLILCVVAYTVMISLYVSKIKQRRNKIELTTAQVLGGDLQEAYLYGQLGMIIVDDEKNIIWTNDYLSRIGMNLIDHPVSELSRELETLLDTGDDSTHIKVEYNRKVFEVKLLREASLFLFKDITETENERQVFIDESSMVGYLQIDNYSDLASQMDETTFTVKTSDLQKLLGEYANTYGVYLRPIKNDTFLILGNKKSFERMKGDNFKIVDQIRTTFSNTFTISLGFATGYPGIPTMAQEAREALDVAISRGGDQIVVSPYGENLIYIGGKTESKHSENRAKIRVLSQSFTTTIKNASNVLIIGHYMADFDAIGACIGVYAICQALKIPAKIIYDPTNVETNCKHAFANTFTPSKVQLMTANYNDATLLITPKTLLVVVDINYPSRLLFPNFIQEDDDMKVAIIDHHRPGASTFHNIVFNGIDSSASSTCELVSEYIAASKYKIDLTPEEATFMLAGTMLDTDHFRSKVSAATFEAMGVLKRFGADSLKADDFLKEDYEQYSLKVKFMNHLETPFTGIIIATDPDETELVDQSVLALVSQESMTIAGIDAAFTIGRVSDTEVGISARSNATVNVELIMRKMGGGGHFAAAATSLQSTSVSAVADRLKEVLNDYLSMARSNKRQRDEMSFTQTLTNIKPM